MSTLWDRLSAAKDELTTPPVLSKGYPLENIAAQGTKNLLNAWNALQPDPVSIPGLGDVDFQLPVTAAAGSLKNKFPTSRLGRLIENQVKPWELSPEEWTKFLRNSARAKHIPEDIWDQVDSPNLARFNKVTESKTYRQPIGDFYSQATGAHIQDLVDTSDPSNIITRLSAKEKLKAPDLDFADIPNAYGSYYPLNNKIRLNTDAFDQIPSHALADKSYLKAATLGHELEHAKDFQRGSFADKFPPREVFAENLPRGPNMWKHLNQERRDFLKSVGQGKMADARFDRYYNLKWLAENNPWAFERTGSLGHFSTLGNYDTDFALKSLTKKAMEEGLEVNPRTLEVFPDIRDTKRIKNLDEIYPIKSR